MRAFSAANSWSARTPCAFRSARSFRCAIRSRPSPAGAGAAGAGAAGGQSQLQRVGHPFGIDVPSRASPNSVSIMCTKRSPGVSSTRTMASASASFHQSCHTPGSIFKGLSFGLDLSAHFDNPPTEWSCHASHHVRDRDAGVGGLSLTDMPYPHAGQNDVIVRVLAGGSPPASWTGRQHGPTAPGTTGRRACQATSCRVSSPSWGTNHRPHRRPAGVRLDRLDPQRVPGRVHRGGGPQPRSAPS